MERRMTAGKLRIVDADLDGDMVDVSVHDGRVASIDDVRRGRIDADANTVVDAGGGALIPGLHDHHLHLLAMAAARRSIDLGPPAVTAAAEAADTLRRADRDAPAGAWLRAVGYHESVAGDIDRHWLDTVVATRPVRVQHRSGACWIVNTAASRALDLDRCPHGGAERDASGAPTGRMFGLDQWLGERVPRLDIDGDVLAAAHQLAAYGITAVTDATPFDRPDDVAPLVRAAGTDGFPIAVTITGGAALPLDIAGTLPRGPVKIVLADHALPGLDDVVTAFRAARAQRRAVAVHCVTAAALVLALGAWDDVGVEEGDRVEHGAVIPLELIDALVERKLTVVTQPRFVHERGDAYRADIAAFEQPDLWRCGSLVDAGAAVAGSSDAPYGSADPWLAIATATDRRTRSGSVLGGDEVLDARRALALYLGPLARPGGAARRVAVGVPADLCVLDVPLATALASPGAGHVALTVARGEVTYRA